MNDDHQNERINTAIPSSSSLEAAPLKNILELDHVFTALGHPRRRYLIYAHLAETEWFLTELAMKIAAWEHDCEDDSVGEALWKPIYVSLYHSHIPKLVDAGVVSFDEETETIRAAENAAQVIRALEGIGASLDTRQEAHARSDIDDDRY